MAREERSAGFIVFRRDPATGQRLYLLLDYGRFWDYAKGHVEAGEDDLTAARRELAEEAGIADPRLVAGFREEISYFFRSRGSVVRKTVVFFLGESPSAVVTLSHEHVGFAWLDFPTALDRATYPTAKRVIRAAQEWLEAHAGDE